MRAALPEVVALWIEGIKHSRFDCHDPKHDCWGYRMKCMENLAKRGGLPEMQQVRQEVTGAARTVLAFDFADPFPDALPNGNATPLPAFTLSTRTDE